MYIVKYSQWQSVKNLIKGILFNIELKRCKYCNKELNFQAIRTHSEYCSTKCAHNDPIIQKQMQETCKKKYGVKNVSNVKQIRDKAKKTCKQKFGQEIVTKSPIIKQKIKQIFQQKFGVNAYTQTQQFKEKSKVTCKEKYGCQFAAQAKEIRQKQQQTCFKKYGKKCYLATQQNHNHMKQIMQEKFGVNFYSQTNQFKEKFKQTCNQKFDVDNPTKSNIIKEKVKQSNINKFGVQHNKYLQIFETFKQWQKYIIPLFDLQDYHGPTQQYLWKCNLCGNIFKSNIRTTRHIKGNIYKKLPRCQHCFPSLSGTSNKQKKLIEFCKQYYSNLHSNYWKLLKNLQVDIYIEQLNLAIQFNGNFWHQYGTQYGVKPGYHLNKTQLCNQKGIRLIHIWQDEWDDNEQQIKQKLLNIFQNRQEIPVGVQVDFSWFNNTKNYQIQKFIQPEIIKRGDYLVQNCGKVIFKKVLNELN